MPFRLLFAETGYVHVCGHRGNSMNAPENTLPALEERTPSGRLGLRDRHRAEPGRRDRAQP